MSVIKSSTWIPLVVALAASVGASRVAQADDDDNVIKKVDFTDEGQSTTIHIRGSDTPTFTVYKLDRPNRVVIDVSGAELGAAVEKAQENGATIAVGSWAVSQVAAYELEDGEQLVRVVVTLAHPGRYDVEANGNELVVTVVARDPAPEKVDAEALAAAKEAAEQAKKDSESAKTAKTKAEGDAAKAKEQADAAKAEAKKAKQALADAEAKSTKADKASKADKKRAAEELAAAKAEADRAAKALAAAQKDADKTTKAVAAAKAEAERTREAADAAKQQVETMAAELEIVKAEAKAAKKDAKAAKDAETAAKNDAKAAKNDAKAAKDAEVAAKNDAKAAKDDAKAAKDDAKAAKDAEQAAKDAAKAAKADAKKHARDADDARSDADAARSDADRAKAEAAREKQEAAAAKAEAEQQKKEAAAAKADAELLKKEAAAAKAEAAQQKKEAAAAKAETAALKKATAEAEAEAERLAGEAETARADAKRARSDADVAQKDAKKKKAAADAAEKEARAQREAAELARAEAAEHERDAEAMRKEAEGMRDEARARLADAEAEAKAAKQTQADAVAAQKKAEAREAKAREAEDTAAAERKAAKEALAAAEKAKQKGDADADEKMKEAEARLAKAEKARVKAEDKRVAAEQAAETARDEAARRKAETADAVAARTAAEDDKQAAEDAATEAKASAKRAEELRLAEVEAANKAAEAKLAADDAERSKASKKDIEAKRAEAAKLEKLAKKATKKREAEESELASIVEQRRQAEADLDQVKVARVEAEVATKKAKQAKAEAEAEAAQAKKDADAARKEAAVAKQDAEAANKDAEAAKARKRTAEADAEEAPPPAKKTKKETKKETKKTKKEPAKAVAVKNVEFEQDGDDAQVIVSMGGKVEAEVVQVDEHSAELLLSGADLPDKLQRKLDVRKFDGAVRAVSTFRDPDDATKVRVVVELSGEASPRLERVGEDLVWHFDGAGAVAQVTPTKKTKTHKTQDIPAPVVGGYGATSSPVTSTSVAQSSGGKKRVYHGPAIDLDFKDADIHNLLRFLANIGRVSIVVPDDIKATVTVRLKKVPWDQALEVILESKGLWYRKTGSLYRIDSRTVLDEEDQKEAERIRAAIQAEAPEAEVFTLNYASAKDTAAKLEPLLSPKGRIEVDSRTNSLIINDIKAHRRRIIDLAARLDIQTPQVMIEARIVEARSTYAREIGIQWGGSANASQAGGNATGLLFPNSIGVAGGADDRVTPGAGVATPTDFAVNLPATVGTGLGGALGVSLGSVGGNFNLNLRLSAAEDMGTVRIVSQPKITVLNNTEAEISQGVSIPISVVSAQGTQTQFVPADLALTVTPYVSQRDCSIAMDVKVTKNEPDFVNTGARGDPTILRKEAHTKILVADGETTVMGGITTRNSGLAYNKVPFFGDLPVIGWFFKHRSENDDRTELLIFITPTITNRGFLTCE